MTIKRLRELGEKGHHVYGTPSLIEVPAVVYEGLVAVAEAAENDIDPYSYPRVADALAALDRAVRAEDGA